MRITKKWIRDQRGRMIERIKLLSTRPDGGPRTPSEIDSILRSVVCSVSQMPEWHQEVNLMEPHEVFTRAILQIVSEAFPDEILS